MQIQAAFLSASSLRATVSSSVPIPPPPKNEPATTTAIAGEAPAPVDDPVPPGGPAEVDRFRAALEDVFRARLDSTEETRHGRRRHQDHGAHRAVNHGLRDIRHAVKRELKSMVRALEGAEGIAAEGDDQEPGSIRSAIKQIGKEFDRTLKSLGHHDHHHHHEAEDPAAVLGSVRTAFEDLFTKLGAALGVPEETPAAPTPSTAFELSVTSRLDVSATMDTGGGASPVAAPTDDAMGSPPVEPGPVSGADDTAEMAQEPAPDDPLAGIREMLSSLVNRFESLFAEFESVVAPIASEETGETGETDGAEEGESGEVAAVPTESTPTSMHFEMAITAYTSVRIEFSAELPGSTIDAPV